MKTLIVILLALGSMCAYGGIATSDAAFPPHKTFRSMHKSKVKKVKIRGYDRARSVKKVHYYRKGHDYYSRANRPSYLRMMGKAINGDKYFR
ncbi:MAG: hypothetical protein WKF87_22090 [Chryseolinea sp.]